MKTFPEKRQDNKTQTIRILKLYVQCQLNISVLVFSAILLHTGLAVDASFSASVQSQIVT